LIFLRDNDVKEVKLEIERRDATGKGDARRARAKGILPASVYSKEGGSIPASLSHKDFVKIAKSVSSSHVFTITSGDKDLDGKMVIVKEIQKNYLKENEILHVDFQALKKGQEISVDINLEYQGNPVGVKDEGGVLSISAREITVTCRPSLIPEHIVVDISKLALGDSMHASEIVLPEGVRLDSDPETNLASVVAPRSLADEEAEAAEAAEGEEGEEGAEGESGESKDESDKSEDKDKD